MNTKNRIEKFNKENAPFYLMDHGKEYSLCLLLGGTPTAAAEYGQYAFDHHAESIGKPVEENGWLTYGDGYDWECVFKKAFESDDNLRKLTFDSESSGFFCYCEDLAILESFGSRFKALCEDRDKYTELVENAMRESEAAEEAELESKQEQLTVKDFIEQHPTSAFNMLTPMGYVCINAEQAANLLKGIPITGHLGFSGTEHSIEAEDLLPLPVEYCRQEDEETESCYAMVGMPSLVEDQGPTISM